MVAAALCGCTSTDAVTPAPSLAPTGTAVESDAGFQVALPDTVAVLPERPGREASITVAGAEPVAAAFAAATPTAETVFPAAPKQPAQEVAVMAAIQPVAYAGPVPSYLAPPPAADDGFGPIAAPPGRGEVEKLIEKYASLYEVPLELVRHVVNRESTFNPRAYNRGNWGLMQIKHQTARGMGYRGPADGLLDADTNLKYAVKYLRGAWLVAGGDQKRADWLYRTGYYYEAKRKGLLEVTGLGVDRKRRRTGAQDVKVDPERLAPPPVLVADSAS